MSTGCIQHHTITTPRRSLLTRVADHVRQLICGMHGHDSLLHFERGRMSLLCTSCGHESPGWELKPSPRPQAAQGSSRIVRLPLVGERRVA